MATVPTALAGRHFLKELDFSQEEFLGPVSYTHLTLPTNREV